MPRRLRPPLTTREIAAYLAGSRLWAEWATHWATGGAWGTPSREWVLARLAKEDAEVLASMEERRWWDYFWLGWEQADR